MTSAPEGIEPNIDLALLWIDKRNAEAEVRHMKGRSDAPSPVRLPPTTANPRSAFSNSERLISKHVSAELPR